jgi:cytidine deaminase
MICKSCSPTLEFPEISLKQYPRNAHNLFSIDSYAVAVNYWIYDKKRKTIINSGSSRACGLNREKASIHAEQRAINFCRKSKNKNLQIFIWRWGKKGNIKPTYCCLSCSQLVKKYGYENNIFTFHNQKKVSSVVDNPSLSLAYKIKYGLLD